MIVPMKKVCLVVQEKLHEKALKTLRDVGVVHLERRALVDLNSNAQKRKAKIEQAMGLIREFKLPKETKQARPLAGENIDDRELLERRQKPVGLYRGRRVDDIFGTEDKEPFSLNAVRGDARPYLPDLILEIDEERQKIKEQALLLSLEINRIEKWGDFDPESIKEISSFGIPVSLYEISPDDFAKIDEDIQYIKLKENKNMVLLVVFGKKIQSAVPFQLPEKSLSVLLRETEKNKLDLEEIENKLKSFVNRQPALVKEMAKVEEEIEFENAIADMEKVEDIPANHGLSWLTGYVPKEDVERLRAVARDNGWGLSAADPEETDDAVPTKLKNSKIVSLLNPITGFLGIVPGYREVDISSWFLIFFCIFFSMIFGDAVYGILFTIIALIGIIKTVGKGVPQTLQILLLLGVCNTIWGVMTCSWLGMPVEVLPQFLKDISFSLLSTAKSEDAIVTQNVQILCFSLGLLHLTIAHIKGMIINIRSPRFLAEIGSIGMLCGMYNLVLFLVVSNETREVPLLPISLYLLAGGFFLSFVFAYYEGNLGQSILSSFKNIITVVLGLANVFSDIMSYIRLWAVGLAGASIALTVYTMAGPLLGGFLIFAGVFILILGHGINVVLNVLSVLVHGVRLNTLEFSGHVGLTWSGTAYKPFAKRVVKDLNT